MALPRPDIALQEAAQQKLANRLPALLSEAKRRESVQRVVIEKRNHAQHGAHERCDRDTCPDQLCQVLCCQSLLRLDTESAHARVGDATQSRQIEKVS